ncbi:MAG: agmatinase [Geminicoccaceae bacterium]
MHDRTRPRPTDNAFLAASPYGGSAEATYAGALSFMRRRYSRDLAGVDVAVWGIPFDAAVSNRPGARFGPQAIRRASAIFDGDPQWPFGIDPYERLAVVDYGDCVFDYGRTADVPACIRAQAADILASGATLVTLGGDHSVTLPLLEAHVDRHGPLALVQFDAHQDTWHDADDRVDHGNFVAVAVRRGLIRPERSIQVGIRTVAPTDCGLEILDGEAVQELGPRGIVERIAARVGDARAYLTFDIDCLDPAYAPGTGTPVAGGPSSAQMLMTLRRLGGIDWVGFDVVEVSPPYDHADITAIAGSSVAMYYMGLIAERRR